MRGSPKTTYAQAQPATASVGSPSPAMGATAGNGQFDNGVLAAFLFFTGLYLLWAFIETHESVEGSIRPQNIKLNVRTMVLVAFTAALGSVIIKVVLAKFAYWGVPGAAHALAFFAAA